MTWNTQKALTGPRSVAADLGVAVLQERHEAADVGGEVGLAEGAAVDEAQHRDAGLDMDDLGRQARLERRDRGRALAVAEDVMDRNVAAAAHDELLAAQSATKEMLVSPPFSGSSATGPRQQARWATLSKRSVMLPFASRRASSVLVVLRDSITRRGDDPIRGRPHGSLLVRHGFP